MTDVSTGAGALSATKHLSPGQIHSYVRKIISESARDGKCALATHSLRVKLGQRFGHDWARGLTPNRLQYLLKYNRDLLGIQPLASRTYRRRNSPEFHGRYVQEGGSDVGGHGYARKDLSRFGSNRSKAAGLFHLHSEHPALAEARTLFPTRTFSPLARDRVLIPGHSNPKIGGFVVRGKKFAGAEIRTLTLQERATCARTCTHWTSCMGNNMPAAIRLVHGLFLEYRLHREIGDFDAAQTWDSANLLLVRLHVLGDFYSVKYVEQWREFLRAFPSLRVFGYSAWLPGTKIGNALLSVIEENWDRFAIRFSRSTPSGTGLPEVISVPDVKTAEALGAIVCPAQREKTMTCGTCALCWTARDKVIAFLHHGRRGGPEDHALVDMVPEFKEGHEVEWGLEEVAAE